MKIKLKYQYRYDIKQYHIDIDWHFPFVYSAQTVFRNKCASIAYLIQVNCKKCI